MAKRVFRFVVVLGPVQSEGLSNGQVDVQSMFLMVKRSRQNSVFCLPGRPCTFGLMMLLGASRAA